MSENTLTHKWAPNWLLLLLMIVVGLTVFKCSTNQKKITTVKTEIKVIKHKIVEEMEKASEQSKSSVKHAENVVKELNTKEPPVYSEEREEIKRYLKTYNTSRAVESDTTGL